MHSLFRVDTATASALHGATGARAITSERAALATRSAFRHSQTCAPGVTPNGQHRRMEGHPGKPFGFEPRHETSPLGYHTSAGDTAEQDGPRASHPPLPCRRGSRRGTDERLAPGDAGLQTGALCAKARHSATRARGDTFRRRGERLVRDRTEFAQHAV